MGKGTGALFVLVGLETIVRFQSGYSTPLNTNDILAISMASIGFLISAAASRIEGAILVGKVFEARKPKKAA